MDQFIVSARKYRPMTFDSVVGQSHISDTLKNAIKSNHLAQAFLFSGPRGVGKTTCARILAKTINCFDRSENIEPCDSCDSCKSFNEGHSLNVYELDAASNNSVDDIRTLIDQVRFAPQLGTKKVYIIDEVHMLSSQAFNAFLKTLEEPPSHAIFILATTEKHKIIPTILSRCQIFDFNRIDLNDMVRKLEEIANKEVVKAERDALHLIAMKSDGSLRDALSMFDQMVTYAGNDLTYQSVVDNLSILSTDYFFDLTDYLVASDIGSCLNLFNDILQKGFDGHHFILGLAEHMRNLLVTQDHSTIDLLSVGPQIKEKYAKQTLIVSSAFLIKALNILNQGDLNYKVSKNQRLLVELCLINLAHLSKSSEPRQEKKTTNQTESVKPTSNKPADSIESLPKTIPTKAVEATKMVETSEVAEAKDEPSVDTQDKIETIKESLEKDPVETNAEVETESKISVEESIKPKEELQVKEEHDFPKKETILDTKQDPIKPETKAQRTFTSSFSDQQVSIKDYTSDKQTSNESGNVKEDDSSRNLRYTESINDEKLANGWKEILSFMDSQGKISLYATLSKYEPKIVDEFYVQITYDNKSQAEAINLEKTNILEKLRVFLRNDRIQLRLKMSEKQHQKAYTQSEKLEKLIEKNPSINLLKDKLDLDLN